MPRQLIGMPHFCVFELQSACRMLISYFYRYHLGWPLALDNIGAFVLSPLYQGRGVVQHTGHP